MPSRTTASDVVEHFRRTERAHEIYRDWLNYRHEKVVHRVMSHRAEALYRLTPADVDLVCDSTSQWRENHALGRIRRADGESVSEIVKWTSDFAISFVPCHLFEEMGHLPLWPEFRDYCWDYDGDGGEMIGKPLHEARLACYRTGRYSKKQIDDAVQWRLGNAYYSFVREVDLIVQLRDLGLDAQAHPLADALFRSDLWVGDHVVAVYVANNRWRDGRSGSKPLPSQFLGGAQPEFKFHVARLDPRGAQRGQVYRYSREDIENLAAEINAEQSVAA